ncbi:MAG: GGDEF domain-containing protein [Hyphomicrobium sp.]
MSHRSPGDERHAFDVTRLRGEKTVSALITLGHWLGIATALGGAVVLVAYGLDIERIWRPIPGGPACSTVTASLFVLSGIAVASMRAFRAPAPAIVLFAAVGLFGLVRLVEIALGVDTLSNVAPFGETLAREGAAGRPVVMSWQTSAMFTFVAAAFMLRYLCHPKASQVAAALALAPPLVSITGYIYGIPKFYGAMSMTTMAIGSMLAATPLLLGARTGIVRALVSPWDGGRFARLQILVICSVIFVCGFMLQRLHIADASAMIPIFVVISILTVSTTIASCSVLIERNDYRRRRAERTVAHLVLHDPLSGLYNRRFLAEQEDALVSFAKRQNFRISVLMLDLDRFKAINDLYGHQAGDSVIKRVAAALRVRLRRADIAVRYGGEELLVVLLDAELDAAVMIGEQLCKAIEAIDFSDLGFPTVTVSIGAAEVITSMRDAIAHADATMYMAKRAGRNCVVGGAHQSAAQLAAVVDEVNSDRRAALKAVRG